MAQADVLNQFEDVGIAGEQVVVTPLQTGASDVEGGCLAPKERRALVYHDLVPSPAELVGGGQPGHPCSDDSDPHSLTSSSLVAGAMALSREDRPDRQRPRIVMLSFSRNACPRAIMGSSRTM